MSFADNFQCLMRGGLIQVNFNELAFFLEHQNELGINTLKIQQQQDKTYVCKVDTFTSMAFNERFPEAPPYEVKECFLEK